MMRDAYSESGSTTPVSVARVARQPRRPRSGGDRLSLATDAPVTTPSDRGASADHLDGTVRRRKSGLDEWAGRITACLNRTVEGIFATGEALTAAKDALEHGKWEDLFTPNAEGVRRVPMTSRTAHRFMEIYRRRDALVANRTHVSDLPSSWGTLYQLAALPEDTLTWALDHGKVRADMERKDVAAIKTEFGGETPASKRGPREYSDLQTRLSELIAREFKQWPDEGDAPAFQDALLLQVNMFTPLTNRRADYVETGD